MVAENVVNDVIEDVVEETAENLGAKAAEKVLVLGKGKTAVILGLACVGAVATVDLACKGCKWLNKRLSKKIVVDAKATDSETEEEETLDAEVVNDK